MAFAANAAQLVSAPVTEVTVTRLNVPTEPSDTVKSSDRTTGMNVCVDDVGGAPAGSYAI